MLPWRPVAAHKSSMLMGVALSRSNCRIWSREAVAVSSDLGLSRGVRAESRASVHPTPEVGAMLMNYFYHTPR